MCGCVCYYVNVFMCYVIMSICFCVCMCICIYVYDMCICVCVYVCMLCLYYVYMWYAKSIQSNTTDTECLNECPFVD